MIIFFTSSLSYLIVGRKILRYQWIAIFFIFIGIFLVGLSQFTKKKTEDDASATTIALGIVIILVAQVFQSLQLLSEEKLF